jgi:hypothetical protein
MEMNLPGKTHLHDYFYDYFTSYFSFALSSLYSYFYLVLSVIFFIQRGAIWLYRATQDIAYLNDAKSFYNQYGLSGAGEFSWDSKAAGVQVSK